MPNKKEYLEFVMDWLAPLGEITSRAMMGGHTLYCDGVVFAILAANTLYLKADHLTRPRFDALRLEAFRPFPGKPEVMQYYPPPAEFFEDPEVLADWGRAAVEVGKRAQLRQKRRSG
jgi:DNA transformation protein